MSKFLAVSDFLLINLDYIKTINCMEDQCVIELYGKHGESDDLHFYKDSNLPEYETLVNYVKMHYVSRNNNSQ